MRMIKDKYDCLYLITKVKQGKKLFFLNDDELNTMIGLEYDIFYNKYWIKIFNPKIKHMEIDTIDENAALEKLFELKHLINKGYVLD